MNQPINTSPHYELVVPRRSPEPTSTSAFVPAFQSWRKHRGRRLDLEATCLQGAPRTEECWCTAEFRLVGSFRSLLDLSLFSPLSPASTPSSPYIDDVARRGSCHILHRIVAMSFSPQIQPAPEFGTHSSTSTSFTQGEGSENPPPPTSHKHASQDALALRSCITCRRRKVRCDKRSPCSNCVKAGIECIFPPPGRAPRKVKRQPAENAELLTRLQQLENIVEAAMTNSNTQATPSPPQQRGDPPARPQPSRHEEGEGGCPGAAAGAAGQMPSLEHEFGRLVIEDNRSRYVSNRFWASLGDQVGYSPSSCGFVSAKC